jgi:DNA-binding transcriptional MerR regulator
MAQSATVIPEKIYFKIGEVCDLVGVQPHVLRYWETEFPMLSPQKNRSGQRSYRRRDVEMALRIKELLYDEMFTIAGAKKKLAADAREGTKLKIVHPEPANDGQPRPTNNPSLFEDDEINIDDSYENESEEMNLGTTSMTLEKREALRRLSAQLLELREILRTTPDRTA